MKMSADELLKWARPIMLNVPCECGKGRGDYHHEFTCGMGEANNWLRAYRSYLEQPRIERREDIDTVDNQRQPTERTEA